MITKTEIWEKAKQMIGLMKDELGGKIILFVALRPKTYSYLTDENKKAKGTKNYVLKKKLKFKD